MPSTTKIGRGETAATSQQLKALAVGLFLLFDADMSWHVVVQAAGVPQVSGLDNTAAEATSSS